MFHLSRIVTVQQTFLLLLCVPLFQQYHSSKIGEVSKFDGSMINLHKICQIPMTCQCTFVFSDGSRNFLHLFSVSWEVFLFCTDKLESSEWQDLVPRLRIGDCFEIHAPSLVEDFVIFCYQVTKFFCSRYCFASASSARSPCHFGSKTDFAISAFWEVSIKTAHFLVATFEGRSASEPWEKFASAGTSVSSRFSVNSC